MPMITKQHTYLVGIDSGTETGFAEWSREAPRRLVSVKSLLIHQAMSKVDELYRYHGNRLYVRVEDARLRTWIPSMPSESRERGRREGAGSVKRDAVIWEDFLKDLGVDFEMVAPKNNKTKVTHEFFTKLTGWDKPTNGHGRDAAMMVYGY
jgi:hypothetical protein